MIDPFIIDLTIFILAIFVGYFVVPAADAVAFVVVPPNSSDTAVELHRALSVPIGQLHLEHC